MLEIIKHISVTFKLTFKKLFSKTHKGKRGEEKTPAVFSLFSYLDIMVLKYIYYIINTWRKNFGPLFMKIAQTEECEIWHTYTFYGEEVQNANIF